MSYWRRYYRPDLLGWKVTRISDPSEVPQQDVIWLETEPTELDPTGMFYIEYDPALVKPLAFSLNLPTSYNDVYIGNSESFGPLEVAVTGGVEPYNYQWKRSSSNVGSNSPTYGPTTVDSAFPSNGAYNWSCVVTDAEGTVITSNILPVTAYRLPSFTTQPPATLTVTVGDAIAIPTTPATTSKPPRTYQWYKDGQPISGATSSNYNKATSVAGDAGTYYLIVTDANGKTVQSNNCVVTVNPAAEA